MSEVDVDRLRRHAHDEQEEDDGLIEDAADEIERLRSAIHGKQGWVEEYASLQCLLAQERMGRESTDNSNTDLHGEIDRLRDQLVRSLDALLASHGGCRMLSVGDECECGLCKRDRQIADLQAIVDKLPEDRDLLVDDLTEYFSREDTVSDLADFLLRNGAHATRTREAAETAITLTTETNDESS